MIAPTASDPADMVGCEVMMTAVNFSLRTRRVPLQVDPFGSPLPRSHLRRRDLRDSCRYPTPRRRSGGPSPPLPGLRSFISPWVVVEGVKRRATEAGFGDRDSGGHSLKLSALNSATNHGSIRPRRTPHSVAIDPVDRASCRTKALELTTVNFEGGSGSTCGFDARALLVRID